MVAGTLNKDKMEECTFESSLISIKPHPGYNFWTRANDIGLATFAEPIEPYANNIKPITLEERTPQINQQCVAVGWGDVNGGNEDMYSYAQRVEVLVLAMGHCKDIYKELPENIICFGAKGVAMCQADIGTVVFCNEKAVGVVAIVGECKRTEDISPFVAFSVPKYYKWIMKNDSVSMKASWSSTWIMVAVIYLLLASVKKGR